jgi:hypothetical protein
MTEAPTAKEVRGLVADLRSLLGDNLESVILYGSMATGDEWSPDSDHNLLVVLNEAALADLERLRTATGRWTSAGQPPPVLFTKSELERAADVFPIEFLQMQQAHRVLHGSDALTSLDISANNLRHQTEYELRTKFIQLRRLYIFQSLTPEKLTRLMVDSFSSFAALFRAVLMLHGEDAPVTNAEAARRTITLLSLDRAPFEWILKQKAGDMTEAANSEVDHMFATYLRQIEQVIRATDRLTN